MLRLGRSLLAQTQVISSHSGSPVSHLRRLLSATAPRISPNPSFAVEDYLVGACGLTRAQALKASPKVSHLKSSTNPDDVLTFLAGLGLSGTEVGGVIAKDPKLLCAGVEKTLTPTIIGLTGLGLSHTEIASLVSLAPANFRRRSVVSNLQYYLSLFGSSESLVRFVKQSSQLLRSSLEKVVKPNVAFLRYCGLGDGDITKLCLSAPWMLSANPERVQVMAVCAEGLGVPAGSGMFRNMLDAIAFIGEENVAAKLEYLKKIVRWSDAEVRIAICKAPGVLKNSKESLQRRSEFFFEVGLEPAYIAHQPSLLTYSLEGRLKPHYYVVKFLKENGLVKCDPTYCTVVKLTEKAFVKKFICPHNEAAPHLSEDYVAACRGELVPCVN